ncbi:MAG TPA: hypothetical protein VEB23_16900 [Ramlibacter sp.]|nr:hypothetical protein [Ramlibacter sp.]
MIETAGVTQRMVAAPGTNAARPGRAAVSVEVKGAGITPAMMAQAGARAQTVSS